MKLFVHTNAEMQPLDLSGPQESTLERLPLALGYRHPEEFIDLCGARRIFAMRCNTLAAFLDREPVDWGKPLPSSTIPTAVAGARQRTDPGFLAGHAAKRRLACSRMPPTLFRKS
jgi:hypothetical protein